jgi:hypothetical protein
MKISVEIGGMTLTGSAAVRGGMTLTGSAGEKPVPEPLCPPKISHGLAWDRTRASAMIKSKISLKGI